MGNHTCLSISFPLCRPKLAPLVSYTKGKLCCNVDIFLFLSAFGLSYSYKENSLSHFYKNRLIRIFPLFVIAQIVCTLLVQYQTRQSASLIDWISNLSSFSYYGIGGTTFNWYISFILLLYILFPLLHLLIKKLGIYALLLASILIFVIFHNNQLEWQYDCALSRLSMFLYGIYFVMNKNSRTNIILGGVIVSMLSFFSYASYIRMESIGLFVMIILLCSILIPPI